VEKCAPRVLFWVSRHKVDVIDVQTHAATTSFSPHVWRAGRVEDAVLRQRGLAGARLCDGA